MPYKDKERCKEYYEANKDKLKENNKKYREANKEKEKEYNKKYREENKERLNEKKKEYYQENKDKLKEKEKKYRKTENGRKSQRIKNWKKSGLICNDFDKLYDYYINCCNCEECNVELIEGNYGANKKVLDHDHKTGKFRNVVCNTCNVRRGINDKNIIKPSNAESCWKYQLKCFILS